MFSPASVTGASPSPSRLNIGAQSFSPTPLSGLATSSLPEDEPVEAISAMELNTAWEIDYNDIEFEGGVPSSQNRIGHGGFGEVFLGRYHGSLVAVKKLFNQDMMGKGLSDFRREVQMLSRLRHPSIVLARSRTQAPNLTIVLEYMDKGSLHQFIHRTTTPYSFTHTHPLGDDDRAGHGVFALCKAVPHRTLRSQHQQRPRQPRRKRQNHRLWSLQSQT